MIYRFKTCELNTERILLKRGGHLERIEPQVFNTLLYLINQRGRVVSRDELLNEVWGHEHVSESTLSSCIKMVRRAVGDSGAKQEVIRTVHGKGYEFVADLDDLDTAVRALDAEPNIMETGTRGSNLPAPLHAL